MAHTNKLISFLRHYGPIATSDNMYDELIQDEIKKHEIEKPINIEPIYFNDVLHNFNSANPKNIILTGTAGDGKTHHCRLLWEKLDGGSQEWAKGNKILQIELPKSGKTLTIVKDLSELKKPDKTQLLLPFARSMLNKNDSNTYLIAANDGQLMATLRDWKIEDDEFKFKEKEAIFYAIEELLIGGNDDVRELNLCMYNLSQLDACVNFQKVIKQIVNHPQWKQCNGCELLKPDGETTCPIRINRALFMDDSTTENIFLQRLVSLLKLASANRMHLPIRDLLMLGVNIILGDSKYTRILLNCRTAKNRAKYNEYKYTNPFANVFGSNIPYQKRKQYNIFTTLETFGIGEETNNYFDNLLIYDRGESRGLYQNVVSAIPYYGKEYYENLLSDYLEGERQNSKEFMETLQKQRQSLFFVLDAAADNNKLNPWELTVYKCSGTFLNYLSRDCDVDVSKVEEKLIIGLNRTFSGIMIQSNDKLYIGSSGGDGRGTISSFLDYEVGVDKNQRTPYIKFATTKNKEMPCIFVLDPIRPNSMECFELQLTHFEYLMRVAKGSLPASFSRQCYEDFIDFKLKINKFLDKGIQHNEENKQLINLRSMEVDDYGRVILDNIKIRTS